VAINICLPIHALRYVSLKHILVFLTRFLCKQNPMRILHNNSVLADPKAFLLSLNRNTTRHYTFKVFWSIWPIQKIWSVVDLFHRTQHWWSLISSTTYVLNFKGSIFDNILYEGFSDNYYSQFRKLVKSQTTSFLFQN
jgi:hypothetical protein